MSHSRLLTDANGRPQRQPVIDFRFPMKLRKVDILRLGNDHFCVLRCGQLFIAVHNHIWWCFTVCFEFYPSDPDPLAQLFINIPDVDSSVGPFKAPPKPESVALAFNGPVYRMGRGDPNPPFYMYANANLTISKLQHECANGDVMVNLCFSVPAAYYDMSRLVKRIPRPVCLPAIAFSTGGSKPPSADALLKDCLAGVKHQDADVVVIFGDPEAEPLTKYYVHRTALTGAFPSLIRLFVTRVNFASCRFIISSAGDILIVPFVKPSLATAFLTYVYTRELILPSKKENLYDFGVIMAGLLENTTLDVILEHWEALLIDKIYEVEKSTDGTLCPVTEALHAFISILNDTSDHFKVARRIIIVLLAETSPDVISKVRSEHFREHEYLDAVIERADSFRGLFNYNYVFHFEDLGSIRNS